MWRLLKWLVTGDGHLHHWEDYEKHRVFGEEGDSLPTKVYIIQKCTHCGKIKKVQI